MALLHVKIGPLPSLSTKAASPEAEVKAPAGKNRHPALMRLPI